MSYQRWSKKSNIYLYPTELSDGRHIVACCLCLLRDDDEDTYTTTVEQTLQHIEDHRKAGHLVGTAAGVVKSDTDWLPEFLASNHHDGGDDA